jgi:hypothetical protein
MGDSNLTKRLPREVQELISHGTYNAFHAKNNTGFIVITKLGKNFQFDENGSYTGETKEYPSELGYEQVYTTSPAEWAASFKVANG